MTAYMATTNNMADSTTKSMANSTTDSMANSTTNSMAESMTNSMYDREDSMTIVGHFSHISIMVVGVIVDMLGPAIGKQHSVGSLSHSCTVVRLLLAEVGPGEVVIHAVVVGVGNNLTQTTMTS